MILYTHNLQSANLTQEELGLQGALRCSIANLKQYLKLTPAFIYVFIRLKHLSDMPEWLENDFRIIPVPMHDQVGFTVCKGSVGQGIHVKPSAPGSRHSSSCMAASVYDLQTNTAL